MKINDIINETTSAGGIATVVKPTGSMRKRNPSVFPKRKATKKMKEMTKAKLEELGREFSIELDKRKTKDKMITDLRAGVKALNKQLK